MLFPCVSSLTGLRTLAELVHEGEWVLDDIQDGQQGACETQQLTEAVETKVNQVSSQIHHLKTNETRISSFLKKKKEQSSAITVFIFNTTAFTLFEFVFLINIYVSGFSAKYKWQR